jgi:hypothetical protein
MAVASLVLALVCPGLIITPLLAVIFGIVAKKHIRAARGQLIGGGMATAGIIIGAIYLLITIVYLLVFGLTAMAALSKAGQMPTP